MAPRLLPACASYWLASIDGTIHPAPPLRGGQRCDVAIVGAGYAGLWTAYYLKQRDPALDVCVLEAEFAGRGAAGRNGGWCSLDLANLHGLLRNEETRSRAVDLLPHLIEAVDVICEAVTRESIDCDFHKGGMAHVAVSQPQLVRARKNHEMLVSLGLDEVEQWLEKPEMERKVRIDKGLGRAFSPHCAVLHPAKLIRGLAAAAVRLGVKLFEHSPVIAVEPGVVITDQGSVQAEKVVLASEAIQPPAAACRLTACCPCTRS